MTRTLRDRISDYRNDPFHPTPLPLAVFYGLVDWVWFRPDGQVRRYKPSNFDNPVSRWIEDRLLNEHGKHNGRKLTILVRVLLNLGF